jgi:hypothetical protein
LQEGVVEGEEFLFYFICISVDIFKF